MSNVFEFNGYIPVIDSSAFIHPTASIIGNVVIGKNVFIGPGASLRGDIGEIIIEDNCNVQDNCTIHMFPGASVILKEYAHIGHNAVIHGAYVGYNVLVGMSSVVMDNSKIGDHSIVGALTFVPENMEIPERKIVVGNPARIIKDVPEKMSDWKKLGTEVYIHIAKDALFTLKECEPLFAVPKNRKIQPSTLKTWKEFKEE